MRISYIAAVSSALLMAAMAPAQMASMMKAGSVVTTADGKRIGRVDRVITDSTGNPTSISLIYSDHFVRIPASTVSTGADGLTTTLTRADVSKLR